MLQNRQLILPYRKKLRKSKSSCRGLDLCKKENLSLHVQKTRRKKIRNKQKHINVTVANQFTVHKRATRKKFFLKRVKHQWRCFTHHFTVIKKCGALLLQRRKANLRRATLTITHTNFRKNWEHLISLSRRYVQSKIKISGGSFYNRPKPFSGLT